MKIRITGPWLIAFFALTFLITECHDWVHYMTAALICGCFGTKAFETWTICQGCHPGHLQQIMIGLSGPVFNYTLFWTARSWMSPSRPMPRQVLGFILLTAALPLDRILAAVRGGGDEKYTMGTILDSPQSIHYHAASLAGLAIVLLFTLPPLVRAFRLSGTGNSSWLIFAGFLVIPGIVQALAIRGLYFLLGHGIGAASLLPGTPWLVAFWTILCAVLACAFSKNLPRGWTLRTGPAHGAA
jgi:hypothetical protein